MTLYCKSSNVFNRLSALRRSYNTIFANKIPRIVPNLGIYDLSRRNLHVSNNLFLKIYADNENSFAHKVMEDNLLYKRTLTPSNLINTNNELSNESFFELIKNDWTASTSSEIADAFKQLSFYAKNNDIKISSTEFDNIVKAIVERKNEFSDDELFSILLHLSLFSEEEGIRERNFHELWKALDETCRNRANAWDIDQILFVADCWYRLKLVRYSNFVEKNLAKVGRKIKRLTPQQLIQTMFYVNTSRRSLSTMFDFEKNLQNCLPNLSIEEIAVMSMGFFKTKTLIRNPHLLEHILYRTIESAETVHEIALCALVKAIRYSLPIALNESLFLLQNRLVTEVPRLSMLCCVHIALLGTNIQLYNPQLINDIAKKFKDCIESVRLKDIERLTFAFTLFNYDDGENNIYHNIVNELKRPEREEELLKHPRAFACCLLYLSLRGIYDNNLLNKVLKESFITNAYGKGYFNIGREILCLDASIDVELPNYSGSRLNGVYRQKLAKKLTRDIPQPNPNGKFHRTEVLLMDVFEYTKNLYGSEKYVAGVHILPHFERADILICLNNNGSPESLIWQKLYETGAVQFIDKINNFKWVVLIVASKNQLLFGSHLPTGSLLMKIRQLETLGYIPVLIPWYEWIEVTEKCVYLRNKIDTAICNVSKENCMVRSV